MSSLPTPDSGSDALASARIVFRNHKDWADRAIVQLTDAALRQAASPETNSVAVIMKHVAGNLRSRWTDVLTTDGEKPWRDRDDEFVDTYADRGEILADWEAGWNCLFAELDRLSHADLDRTVLIRGEPHSLALALTRSLAHTAYHVGQILFLARLLAGGQWQVITIPRGGSRHYNQQVWGQGHYR